jgi:hypothetical protein
MEALVDVVAEGLEAHSPMGPLGLRYLEEDTHGELVLSPTPVELVGGAADGTVVIPGCALDLHALLAAFEHVTALQWCAHGFGPSDPDGPCVSLEGLYQGHAVWLRVLAEPPEDEEPGLRLDTSAGSCTRPRVLLAHAWHVGTALGETTLVRPSVVQSDGEVPRL